MERKIVHVVGTGTIGEPLIGLLCDYENKLGIDEVTFHKNSALKNDRAKVYDLLERGARLAVEDGKEKEFRKIGMDPDLEKEEAIKRASVIIVPRHIPVAAQPAWLEAFAFDLSSFCAIHGQLCVRALFICIPCIQGGTSRF